MSRADDASGSGSEKDESIAKEKEKDDATVLQGTTLRVYRFLFKQGKPIKMHDIQRGLNLSSLSVAQYHVAKLLRAELIRETEEGYVVDRVVLGNLVRVSRMVLPYQVTYTVFFAAAMIMMLSVLRPVGLPTSFYVFSVIVVFVGFCLSLFESVKMIRGI